MNALVRCLTLAAVIALAGCGGGLEAGVGSGGSGAPLAVGIGPVTGFGSIIVNGERYDETGATVHIDERPDRTTATTVGAIRLGMRVRLQHRDLLISTATIAPELIGPVTSVSASSFIALGQTVRVNANAARPTVFDGFDELLDLAGGAVVEVHGERDGAGDILATRVELKPTGLSIVRLAGTATAVAGKRFSVGSLAVDADAAPILPEGATLSEGQRVVVWSDVPYGGGVLAAKLVRIEDGVIPSNSAITLDGVVAEFASPSNFRVGGLLVDASAAAFTGGAPADLANGQAVRLRGTVTSGVLRAASVEFIRPTPVEVQLSGAVSDFVAADRPFRIRNALARVTPQTTFAGGSSSNLAESVLVRLTGPLVNGIVEATVLEFLPLAVDTQRVVSGAVAAPVSPVAADGSRTFRLEGIQTAVKTVASTRYSNGSASEIAAGRRIEVKGTLQGSHFVADEVEFKDSPTAPPTVGISGIASSVRADSMVVNGQTVQLAADTTYTLNGGGTTRDSLRKGVKVDVVAVRTEDVLTARTVEIESPERTTQEVRGIVSGRRSGSDEFLVGGQRVSVAGDPQVVPGNKSVADIVNGSDIEVEGTLAEGVLSATRIKFR